MRNPLHKIQEISQDPSPMCQSPVTADLHQGKLARRGLAKVAIAVELYTGRKPQLVTQKGKIYVQ